MNIYKGVITNNNVDDMGSVKVRIFGVHSEYNENSNEFDSINDEHLPIAEVLGGNDFGLISGVGVSSILRQGTWVYVVLQDNDPEKPLIIGTVKGTNKERTSYANGNGFNDKNDVYPIKERLDESDINRLVRNDKLDENYHSTRKNNFTSHKVINDNIDTVDKKDSVSGSDVTQSEPESTSNKTIYPNSSVIETQSGHVVEIDDTEDNERIRVFHSSGSYFEFKPDGSFVMKSVGEEANHFIFASDIERHIQKGIKEYVENNIDQIILGGIRKNVQMDLIEHIGGYFKIQADGNLEISNDVKITGNLQVSQKITANSDITSGSEVADSSGNLSSLRNIYNSHTHTQGAGNHYGAGGTTTPPPSDPESRASDFSWSNSPKGFK